MRSHLPPAWKPSLASECSRGANSQPAFLTRLRARTRRGLDWQGERESGRAGVLDSTSSTRAAFNAANAVRSASAAVTWREMRARAKVSGRSQPGIPALGLALVALAVTGCVGNGGLSSMSSEQRAPQISDSERALRQSYAAHPEFRNQYGLGQIRAHHAYARGATGEGVTLGIVDSGIDPNHPKFQGEGKLASSNIGDYNPDFTTCDSPAPDGQCLSTLGHGTHVGGIMAASRRADADDPGAKENAVHGVAFDARVISVGFQSTDEFIDDLPASLTPEQLRHRIRNLESELEKQFAQAFTQLNARKVTAINASFGLPGNIEDFEADALRARFPNVIETIAQADTPAGERTIYVWSAGNAGGEISPDVSIETPESVNNADDEAEGGEINPDVSIETPESVSNADDEVEGGEINPDVSIETPEPVSSAVDGAEGGGIDPDRFVETATSVEIVAGLPARIPELRGHSLAVVATDEEGAIADFSNRCGIAKDFCLAAPGVEITGPVPSFYCGDDATECYLTLEQAGTSSAAPFVTGGIGLLAEHYRGQLGNDEIVARLLETADRTGDYADADVYGQGFLDLGAATAPVGETRMLIGDSLTGASAPSHRSMLHVGAAFGDSMVRGLAAREVARFDALDAPFFGPLGHHLQPRASAAPSVAERFATLGRDPLGASWRMGGAELRLRLDATATPSGVGAALGSGSSVRNDAGGAGGRAVPGSLGALSLTHDLGPGRLRFGYRTHPGWQFGLHAGDGTSARGFGPLGPGTFTDDGVFANPFLGFARDGASLGFATALGAGAFRAATFHGTAQHGERRDADAGEATGVLMEYRLGGGGAGLAMQAGWLAEAEAAVGVRPSGAFGALRADSVIAGLSAHRGLGDGWSLLASAHVGTSRVEHPRRGMVQDMSALRTGSLAVGLIGEEIDHAGGRLAVRLSQPLRVEAGQARVRWVSGRTPDGGVTAESALLDLEPSGRQFDFELVYARPWAGGEAHLAAIATHDAGHVRDEHEAALLARYRHPF